MASRRSHVSSGSENDAETRRLDRATTASGPREGIWLSSFSTAVLIHRVICTGVWSCLRAPDRQGLIATCREADGWCLRRIRAYTIPTMPPLQTLSSSFTAGRPFALGRFARGFQLQRCKNLNAAFFGRLRNLEPVFDGLDAAACEDLSATAASGAQDMEATLAAARRQERRVDNLYDVVAELGHQVALQELRLQALEAARAEL